MMKANWLTRLVTSVEILELSMLSLSIIAAEAPKDSKTAHSTIWENIQSKVWDFADLIY